MVLGGQAKKASGNNNLELLMAYFRLTLVLAPLLGGVFVLGKYAADATPTNCPKPQVSPLVSERRLAASQIQCSFQRLCVGSVTPETTTCVEPK